MNNWFQHLKFKRLNDLVKLTDKDTCPDFFEPLSRLLIEGRRIDLHDPALQKFMKTINISFDDNWKSIYSIQSKLNTWVVQRFRGPGTLLPSLLSELFELRSSDKGWEELDFVLKYMTGMTFSQVCDYTHILHDSEDPGLNGGVCYSVVVRIFDTEKCRPNILQVEAVASSPENIVPLALRAAEAVQARYDMAHVSDDQPEFYLQSKLNHGEPIQIEIRKNGHNQIIIPVRDMSEAGAIALDWRSMAVDIEDMDMLKALLKVVPVETKHKVKGMFLQNQMGL
jgi:methionine-rich copper-binding protein CopC